MNVQRINNSIANRLRYPIKTGPSLTKLVDDAVKFYETTNKYGIERGVDYKAAIDLLSAYNSLKRNTESS